MLVVIFAAFALLESSNFLYTATPMTRPVPSLAVYTRPPIFIRVALTALMNPALAAAVSGSCPLGTPTAATYRRRRRRQR